jgi:hypothetical protein
LGRDDRWHPDTWCVAKSLGTSQELRDGQILSSLGAAPTSTLVGRALLSTRVIDSLATALSAQGYQEVVFSDYYKQGNYYACRLNGVLG